MKRSENYANLIWIGVVPVLFLPDAIIGGPSYNYMLLRVLMTGLAIASAYFLRESKDELWLLPFVIAIVFNPIIPLKFPRNIWVIIDQAVLVYFLLQVAYSYMNIRRIDNKKNQTEEKLFNRLLEMLNEIKHGANTIAEKKKLSEGLIYSSGLPLARVHDLLEQLEQVYEKPLKVKVNK